MCYLALALPSLQPVVAHHGVEDWLGRVESAMRASLKRLVLKHARQDNLDLDQPQLPLQVSNMAWRDEAFVGVVTH